MASRGWLTGLAVVLSLSAGCGAGHYMGKGDKAAGVGDWETAELEYRVAMQKNPNEPGLKEKYDHAKGEAMKQAKQKANACLASRDYTCASQQADYAAGLDSGDAEAQQLRQTAHLQLGMSLAQQAGGVASSEPFRALELANQARQVSADPQVVGPANQAQATAVQTVLSQAQGLRQQASAPGSPHALQTYDQAIAMLDRLAKYDPRGAQESANAKAERAHWIDNEYNRLLAAGDAAGARHDWNGAMSQYQAAEQLRPGGPARGLMAHGQLCAQGDAAFAGHDLATARDAFTRASQMPEDQRTHYAAQQLATVQQALAGEYQRLAGLGDQALAHHDWPGALAQYQAAERLIPGGRARPLIDYAQACAAGDGAIARKDWKAAGEAYRTAAGMPFDRDHYAATQHERVEIRPYWVTIKSLVVKPLRPDLTPWVGRPSEALAAISQRLVGPRGVDWHAVSMVPPENVPTFQVEFGLPDGRRFLSGTRQGIAANFDAGLVVESNAFDERTIQLRVQCLQPGGAPMDVETISVPISDLLDKKRNVQPGREVLAIDSSVQLARGQHEGDVAGMTPEAATH